MDTRIQPGFPLERLTEPENFLSLLHYFGLLSIRDVVDGVPRLAIPNQTVKRLMYGYLIELKYLKRSERFNAASRRTRPAWRRRSRRRRRNLSGIWRTSGWRGSSRGCVSSA